MQSFLFPFTTCEKPRSDQIIAQPVSATINFITVIILIIAITYAKSTPVRFLLMTYAAFEVWHTYSHMHHIPSTLQTNVVHILGYIIAFTTLYVITYLSQKPVDLWLIIFILLAVIVDLYVWFKIKGIWTVFSGLAIFAVIVLGSAHNLPSHFRESIPFLFIFLFILGALFWNESKNCNQMLQYKHFPYHALIEIVGLILFIKLAYIFIQWDK